MFTGRLLSDAAPAFCVMYIGCMYNNANQITQCIYNDVAFSSFYLFSTVNPSILVIRCGLHTL